MRYLSILICLCMLVGCRAKCPCPKAPAAPNIQLQSGTVTNAFFGSDGSLLITVELSKPSERTETYHIRKGAELTANGATTTTAGVYQLWRLETTKPLLVAAWVHSSYYISQAKFWR